MNKNSREKDMLYEWAKLNGENYCFQGIDSTRESYFEQRKDDADSKGYIREYAFESLPEIMKELDTLWGTDEIMCQVKKVRGVASLKNKPVKPENRKEAEKECKTEPKEKLPVFIYNF